MVNEDDERGGDGVSLGRTLALSDGIFAIAMTLAAFQIQAPAVSAGKDLAGTLGRLSDDYIAYFITFAVIGLLWLAHHRLFRNIERADEPLMLLNLVFLLIVAALPFPSAVLGRFGDQAVAVVLYASAMAAAGLLLAALTLVAHHRRLFVVDSPDQLGVALWRSGSMSALFLASIPVALVDPRSAPFVWILVFPLRFADSSRRRRRATRGQSAASR